MRAGDSDRQVVADRLKQALDEGRLDLGEYDERLRKTYAAKTYGELKGMLDDLPDVVPSRVDTTPVPGPDNPPPTRSARSGLLVRGWLGGFGGIFVVCTAIWLVTSIGSGHFHNFWPVWLLIPMVFGLLGGRDSRRRDRG
jgi:hypothetical protein